MPKFIIMSKFNFLLTFAILSFSISAFSYSGFDNYPSLCEDEIIELIFENPTEIGEVLISPEIICGDKYLKSLDCNVYDVALNASVSLPFWNNKKYNWRYVIIDVNTNDTIQYSFNYSPIPLQGVSGNKDFDQLVKLKTGRLKVLNPLPIGKYRVTWTAEEVVKGKTLTKEQFITVRDETPPTPLISDIALIKPENGLYESKAIDFDKGGCGYGCISSFDNCSLQTELYFTFSPVLPKLYENPEMWISYLVKHGFYSFDPQTGEFVNDTLDYSLYRTGKAHRWYVEKISAGKTWNIDEDNNKQSFIYVWDKFALNEDHYDNNYALAPLIIKLEFAPQGPTINGTVPGLKMIMNAESDEGTFSAVSDNAKYSIEVLPNKTYTVSGYSDDDMMCGITTLDLVIIQKYILGLHEIKSHYLYIAADADGDCEISSKDLLTIRKAILRPETNYFHSYVAINHDYEFKDSIPNPEDCKGAKVRIVELGTQGTFGIDFSVIKIGDLNTNCNKLEDRSADTYVFRMNNSHFRSGDRVVVPVYSMGSEDVSGFQFSLSFKGLQFIDLINGALEIDDSEYRISDGYLLMSVARAVEFQADEGEPLFYLVFEAVSEGTLSGSLQFNNEKLRSEIYHGKDLLISDLELSFNTNTFRLFQNTPNPFTDETSIGFELPDASDYDFQITDITGKVIYKIHGRGEKGYNLIRINNNNLPSSLTLGIYSLKTDLYSDSKKLIRISNQ